jgi:hypothetical protein
MTIVNLRTSTTVTVSQIEMDRADYEYCLGAAHERGQKMDDFIREALMAHASW